MDDVGPPRRSRRRVLVAVVAAVALAAGAVVLWVRSGGDDFPDEWDPRVEEMAAFVEDRRGLDFDHPVPVEFLDDASFQELVARDEELTEEDLADIEDFTRLLRALGLVGADVDILDALDTANQAGIVGLYIPDEQTMYIRGEELDPYVQETVVHELTHALQDQHFDITGDTLDDDDALFLDVVVEGDAQRIAEEWVFEYDDEEFDAYLAAFDAFGEQATPELDTVPRALLEILGLPYALGPALMAIADEDGGREAVDAAFTDPPDTEEQTLDPVKFLEREPAEEVDGYALADGETEVERDTFGVGGLALVLSGRIDPLIAYRAIDGWAGDEYVSFERDGVLCVETVVRMDTPDDAAELADALAPWQAALGDAAQVAQDGSEVHFGSCDREAGAEAPPADFDSPIGVFAARSTLALDALRSGASLEQSFCFADAILDRFGLEVLTRETLTPEEEAAISDLAFSCR